MGVRHLWLRAGGSSIVSYSEFLQAHQGLRRRPRQRINRRMRTVMEALERRLLLTTFTVNNLADDNRSGSLRWAVEQAMSAGGSNTIDFSGSLSGTIDLLNAPSHLGPLVFNSGTNTTINGSFSVIIRGNDDSTVFDINSGATVTLSGVTTQGGNYFGPISAGDIYNDGTLNVVGSTITGVANANFHTIEVPAGTLEGDGGAIFNDSGGILNISGGTAITGTAELGGGIYNFGGAVTIDSSDITGTAETGGGIDNAGGGTVTITNSTVDGCTADISGGGISNDANGTVNISNTDVSDNAATYWGGGIANNSNATLILNNDTIDTNTASGGAGILNFTGAIINATDTDISDNTASITGEFEGNPFGGGIYNFEGTVNFGGTMTGNTAPSGGGIYNLGGTVTLNGASLTSNTSGEGGGVDNNNDGSSRETSHLVVENSTISENSVSTSATDSIAAGGGIYSNSGSVHIISSTLDSNSVNASASESEGGGLYSSGDTIQISFSTISNNTSTSSEATTATMLDPNPGPTRYAFGGGIYSTGDHETMVNSTIVDNAASDMATFGDSQGGGIWSGGTTTLTNCTLDGNTATGSDPDFSDGEGMLITGNNTSLYNTIAHNIIGHVDQDLAGGQAPSSFNLITTRLTDNGFNNAGGMVNGVNNNIVGSDANLGPLQNNGGPTDTEALLVGSPAIDAGSNALALGISGSALTTDQRGGGFPRIVNGTVDIGAYEFSTNSSGGFGSTSGVSSSVSAGAGPSASGGGTVPGTVLPTLVSLGSVAAPGVTPGSNNTGVPYTPQQLAAAYGFDLVSFNGTVGTGAGQTVAIVDAFDDANLLSDANTFSSTFNLPIFNNGGPTLTVLNQQGAPTPLPADSGPPPTGEQLLWLEEESLDVEWVHAIAPQANIVVFEANSSSDSDLMAAVTSAENFSDVSVISMSWGGAETTDDLTSNPVFTTPFGHTPITFLASTGDDAAPALEYPATSPNVVAVGGTRLNINNDGSYGTESAWDGGGGGVSPYEPQPSYQTGNVNGVSNSFRAGPDISSDADPNTGVYVFYSTGSNATSNLETNWIQVGGTSLAAPTMGGMIAVADQGRVINGLQPLDGPTQTLPMLYAAPSSDFNDITLGDNGYQASSGFDLATGLGTPIADKLVPYLAGFSSSSPELVFATQPAIETAGQTQNDIVVDVTDGNGNIITNFNSDVTISLGTGPGTLSGTKTVQAVDGVANFGNLSLSTVGVYTLLVNAGNIPAAYSDSFNVIPGPSAKLVFAQEPTNTADTVADSPAITVRAEDAFGNFVTNDSSSVTLAISQGTTGAVLGGTLTEPLVNGVATFNNVSINLVGAYELTASDGSLTNAVSTQFQISKGTLASLGFSVEPTTTAAGSDITPGIQVTLDDGGGNPVGGFTIEVTLSVASGPGGIAGTLSELTQNGVATFSDISFNTAGSYTLEASAVGPNGPVSGTSASFNIIANAGSGLGTKLGFVDEPTNTNAGGTIGPAVTVDVEDAFGNLITSDNSTVTLSLAGGGVLGGTVSAAAVNGVATFTNLSPQAAGTQELRATDGSDTAGTSSSFTVTAGAATQIGFASEPTGAWVNSPMSPGVSVGVEDAFGNVVTSAPMLITLSVESGPAGGGLGGTLSVTTVNGLASFSNLTLGKAGTYTLLASNNTFGTAVSDSITAIAPPTQRYLLNGIPIGPKQLAAQQQTTASHLPPASTVLESEPTPSATATPFDAVAAPIIAEQSIQPSADEESLSQTPFATIAAPDALNSLNQNRATRKRLIQDW
jgi:hypothetical protein